MTRLPYDFFFFLQLGEFNHFFFSCKSGSPPLALSKSRVQVFRKREELKRILVLSYRHVKLDLEVGISPVITLKAVKR